MTPLAQYWMRQAILPEKKRHGNLWDQAGVLHVMADVHCFEMSAVEPLMRMLSGHMLKNTSVDGRLAFLPAAATWIEVFTPPQAADGYGTVHHRLAFLLLEMEGEDAASVFSIRGLDTYELGILPLKRDAKINGRRIGDDRPGELPTVEDRDDYGEGIYYQEVQATLYAYLSLINTPRVVGRKQHMPHAGLQRDISRSKGMVGKFPLKAWTEIKLEVAAPKWASEKDHETHLTGQKALHFCRSHLRVRLGRVEFVTHHWRGNPAMGIKQSRYSVVPPKQGNS